jgi:hypothetical protein
MTTQHSDIFSCQLGLLHMRLPELVPYVVAVVSQMNIKLLPK